MRTANKSAATEPLTVVLQESEYLPERSKTVGRLQDIRVQLFSNSAHRALPGQYFYSHQSLNYFSSSII